MIFSSSSTQKFPQLTWRPNKKTPAIGRILHFTNWPNVSYFFPHNWLHISDLPVTLLPASFTLHERLLEGEIAVTTNERMTECVAEWMNFTLIPDSLSLAKSIIHNDDRCRHEMKALILRPVHYSRGDRCGEFKDLYMNTWKQKQNKQKLMTENIVLSM